MKIIFAIILCVVVIGGCSSRSPELSQQNSPEVKVVSSLTAQMQISTQKRRTKERFRDVKDTEKAYKVGFHQKRFLIAGHISISRDGKMLAVSGETDYDVHSRSLLLLLDARTGKRLRFIWNYRVQSLVFSPDGKLLITGGAKLRWWNVATGKLWREAETRADSVAISPNGKVLAVADYEQNRLDIWRTKPLQLRTRFGFQADPGRIAFSPDGRQVLSSTGLVYDVAADEMQRLSQSVYHGDYEGSRERGILSPDGHLLAEAKMIRVGNLNYPSITVASTRPKRRLWSMPVGNFPADQAAFSSDGTQVVLLYSTFPNPNSSSFLARVYDARSGQILQTIRRESADDIGDAQSAVFTPDGKTVIFAGTGLDNAIKIVRLTTK